MENIRFSYHDGEKEVSVDYIPRLVDAIVENYLSDFGAVLLRGPKYSGKTTTGCYHSKSWIFLSKKSMKPLYDSFLVHPSLFLEGEKPRLLDEWQTYPETWDLVKENIDQSQSSKQFILTGSYSPKPGMTNHTGSMRISRVNMTTLTLKEMGLSSGGASLKAMLKGEDIMAKNFLTYEDITHLMVRGGFPRTVLKGEHRPGQTAKVALDAIVENDIQETTQKDLRPLTAKAILRSLARNISTYATNKKIIQDVASTTPLSGPTFYEYYDGLLRLFVIHELDSYSPAIRSKDVIRMAPKRQFNEVAIAIAALGLSEDDLNHDPQTRGFFFENFVGHELEVYAQCLDATIGHYHDGLGLEIDFTIHFPDGKYGLIEVKSSQRGVPDAVRNFEKFEALVDCYNESHQGEARMEKPSLKLVITGDSPYSMKRDDGIYVAAIGTLGP